MCVTERSRRHPKETHSELVATMSLYASLRLGVEAPTMYGSGGGGGGGGEKEGESTRVAEI